MSNPARAKALFLEALELPNAVRLRFVHEACAGDDALEREITELLGFHTDRDTRLDASFGDLALAQALPERYPPPPPGYRIVSLLGRGGMGSVWLAERESDGGQVAIKMLTAGMHSREMLARFRREAEILRRLDHPGIGRLLDAGVYAAPYGDQPFLLLEYVQGEMLTAHVSERSLDVPARLALLLQIAEAVSHAHANGVIHRDLKPENILVDAPGRVRVLDFGVARFVDGDGSSLATRTGLMLGTPQYMSPEQVQAEPGGVGPACDVYALGVIGFELLGGQLPYDLRGQSLHRAVITVLTVEPPRLGTLGDRLRGDLENIIAKALEKEPADRYPDAGALVDDLRRYLEGRPVSVRSPSPLKRVWRRIEQRRLVVPAVLVALAITGLFIVPNIEQWRGDAQWRRFFATLMHADDLVHDEANRSLLSIEEAQVDLLACRVELPSLPERPYRLLGQVYLTARLGEAHWLLGDMRSDPAQFELALPEFIHARSAFQPVTAFPGIEHMPAMHERYTALRRSGLDGFLCMAYRALACYRRPAENYLLASQVSGDAARDLLAEMGYALPDAKLRDSLSVLSWPAAAKRELDYVYYCNDLGATQAGYARVSQQPASADLAVMLAREARTHVGSIAGAGPAVGSVFFNAGQAFVAHARLRNVPAELDSAQAQFATCLAYRGPERPHQFAETERALADLELERARSVDQPSRALQHAELALEHLDEALQALRVERCGLASEFALVNLLRARAMLVRAEARPDAEALQACGLLLDDVATAFPRESYPVQGSWNDYLRAVCARLTWQRRHVMAERGAALQLLASSEALAASQDRELLREIAAERERLRVAR